MSELILATSSINGIGLFANRNFKEGYVIGIIDGPFTDGPTEYAIEPRPGLYIETSPPFKFANHSCAANIEILGLRVVVSCCPIKSGDELFFDYGTFIFDNWSMQCRCGQPACRGIINAR